MVAASATLATQLHIAAAAAQAAPTPEAAPGAAPATGLPGDAEQVPQPPADSAAPLPGSEPTLVSTATPSEPLAPSYPPPPSDTADPSDAPEPRRGPFSGLRIALGGRTGYGMPMGEVVTDSDLSGTVAFAVPFIFDATMRLRNGTEVGLYAGILFGGAGDDLDRNCSDCSVFGYHVGIQLNQHLNSTGFLDPYVGLGLGIDSITVSESRTIDGRTLSGQLVEVDVNRSTDLRALPELMLQVGLDIGGDPLSFGPFVSFSAAQFSEQETEVECRDFGCSNLTLASSETDVPADRQEWHAWLTLGVRGTFLLL